MRFFSRFFAGGKARPEDLPDISGQVELGAADVAYRIIASQTNPDRSFRMVAGAIYRGKPVGFAFELGSSWRGYLAQGIGGALSRALGPDMGGMFAEAMGQLSLNQGLVTFHSIGEESDRFVAALARMYEVDPAGTAMKHSVPFAALSMDGDPELPQSGPVLLKLFFQADAEEDCAEVYANIDLHDERLEIREKDSGYRMALVRALTETGGV
jgi:hypothetical protein